MVYHVISNDLTHFATSRGLLVVCSMMLETPDATGIPYFEILKGLPVGGQPILWAAWCTTGTSATPAVYAGVESAMHLPF